MIVVGSSSLNSEISEPITTTTRFKRSIESVIPNSTDKLMPSDSKKRKSLSINRLAYNPLPQQLPFQQEQIIIPAINDNSSESEPTLPPLSSSVTALPIERN